MPSPASRYLVALGRAVAALRPAATIALVTATGRFARFAREGLERADPALGLGILACFSFRDPPAVAAAGADAILACRPVEAEVVLFRALARLAPSTLRAAFRPASPPFPALLGGDPGGLLALVRWHPETRISPELGPSSAELMADARASALGELDYVADQSDAAALIAGRCLDLRPDDPLGAARRLRTTTFFGAFELDPATGLQRGHRLSVVRWSRARQEFLLAEAS